MDTDKLIAFGIFDVTPQFIREIRAEGLSAVDADKLIAFRIHGVSPAMVRDVRRTGLSPSEDQFASRCAWTRTGCRLGSIECKTRHLSYRSWRQMRAPRWLL
jgi:hypothetical protein